MCQGDVGTGTGRGWGSRSRGVCVGVVEAHCAAALRVTDELNLRADRSSGIIPMAEGGGCYGCLTLSNARRGPVDSGQIGGVAWRNRSVILTQAYGNFLIIECVYCVTLLFSLDIDVKMGN